MEDIQLDIDHHVLVVGKTKSVVTETVNGTQREEVVIQEKVAIHNFYKLRFHPEN